MKQKISLFYVAIAFSIAGLCTSCSSDDPVDDTGGGTNNPGGTSSDVKQLDYGELLAFPYAEGHGRNTTGGRGGKVYHVTSLEDDTSGSISGSLRWAMKQDGPKTIVFDVSGTIYLKSELKTQKDDLTIAGQTSPGGICIANYPFTINSSNIIIRFIRFRPGNSNVDCDGLGGCDKQNVIIDHCSVSWGSDECLSVYGMQNSTVQWCLAYQALRVTDVKINAATGKFASHGYGGNWGGNYASYHHNLIAHCESRVPRLGPRYTTLAHIFRCDIDESRFIKYIDLIERLHRIAINCKYTMFLPHHNIIILQFLDGSFRQFYRTRQFIRNDTQTTRAECLCFGNHTP